MGMIGGVVVGIRMGGMGLERRRGEVVETGGMMDMAVVGVEAEVGDMVVVIDTVAVVGIEMVMGGGKTYENATRQEFQHSRLY